LQYAGPGSVTPVPPAAGVTAGLFLAIAGVLLIAALVLGLYRDEVKGLVFFPAGMSLIGLTVSVASAVRRRMRVSGWQFALGTLINGLILLATGLLIYLLSIGWPPV
jgi:hypothetical protein